MPNPSISPNARFLAQELDWLSCIIDARLKIQSGECEEQDIFVHCPAPDPNFHTGPYVEFLTRNNCRDFERLALILALARFLAPEKLDPLLLVNQAIGRRFTEFGGVVKNDLAVLVPTLQSALFLLGGRNLETALGYQRRLMDSCLFGKLDALRWEPASDQENVRQLALSPTPETREELLWGLDYHPTFSSEFPAEELRTGLKWDDLILPDRVMEQIFEIRTWIENESILMGDTSIYNRLAPGYRALLSGPPGTGKTLTASLLGQVTERTVFRVDISKVVSKYIGETEKNLANLFDRASNRDWILFFDEADTLFGKRGEVNSSGDRAANQNASYLLQRIETFDGVVILASNLQENIDEAFMRRFQSVIEFQAPAADDRLRLWTSTFDQKLFECSDNLDWVTIAKKYELTGGQILNVFRHCSLKALREGRTVFEYRDIISGINLEEAKSRKYF